MKRVIVFGSACCTGWVFGYEADDATHTMIKKHVETYNSAEAWSKRNCDGTAYIYDSVEDALINGAKDRGVLGDDDCDHRGFQSLQDMYEFFQQDGEGRDTTAAWVVHMLLSDATSEDWMPV